MKSISIALKLVVIVGLMSTISSCDKEKTELIDAKTFKITASNYNPSPYETVSLKVEGVELLNDKYSVKIGADSITVLKQSSDSLIFSVPYLQPNTYQLSLNIDGYEAKFDLKIKAQVPIPNQAQVLEAFVTKTNNSIADLETATAQTGQVLTVADKALITDLLSSFNAAYNQLSANDKIQFAQYLAIHPEIFQSNSQKMKDVRIRLLLEQYYESFSKKILPIGISAGTFALTITAPDPTFITKAVAFGAAVYLVLELVEVNKIALALYSDAVIAATAEIGFSASNVPIFKSAANNSSFVSTPDFTFHNNKPVELNTAVKFRTIYAADVNSTNSLLKGITTNLSTFQSVWIKVDGAFITLRKLFGYTGSGLPEKAKDVSQITNFQTKTLNVAPENASILNISNSKVKVTVDNSNAKFKVTFSTTESTAQQFNFTYRYVDGVTLDTVYSAIVEGYQPYSIEKISGDKQTGTWGQKLEKPIIIRITGADGKPHEGVKVTFKPAKEGSVSNKEVVTSADGTASAIWTLGESIGTQSLIVEAFKKDNTPLVNSPLTFNATTIEPAISITSVWVSSWSNLGLECKDLFASGAAKIKIQFDGTPHPKGEIYFKTTWSSDGNNSWLQIPVSNLQVINGIGSFSAGFCWGSESTKLTFNVKYVSSKGIESSVYSTVISRPY